MKTLDEIRTILHLHDSDLRNQYGITGLLVFGSVVRGEAREDSDVDMLATFNRPVGILKLIDAEYYLSGLLGTKVDLVPSDEVRPELQEQIFNEAVPVLTGTFRFIYRTFLPTWPKPAGLSVR